MTEYTEPDLDELFQDSLYTFIRRLAPDSNIVLTPANIKDIKEIVRRQVLRAPKSFREKYAAKKLKRPQQMRINMVHADSQQRRGSNDSTVEDEESQMSCDASSEGHSNDEDGSQSTAIEKLHKTSSSSSLPEFKGSHKKMSRAKRLQELRAHRRKKAEHGQLHIINCDSEEQFKEKFFNWYTSEVAQGGDVSFLYHKLLNTVQHYMERISFPSNIRRMTSQFFRHTVIRPYRDLTHLYDTTERCSLSADARILEMQLQVLLDLYTLSIEREINKNFQEERDRGNTVEEPDLKDIIRKLQYIYIATDAPFLKNFLEEQVADNFNHVMPKEVAAIFDELCLNLPADLEEHNPYPNPYAVEDLSPCPRRLRARDDTALQLQAMLDEFVPMEVSTTSASSSTKENEKAKKRTRKDEATALREAAGSQETPTTPKRRERREKIIPETPDEKLQPKEEQNFTEVVKQTPIGKLRQSNRRGSRRLSELVKLSEERTRSTRASALASEKPSRAIMSTTVAPNVTRESLLALHTPSPRSTRSARVNLIDRFNSSNSASAAATPVTPSPAKRGRRAMAGAATTPFPEEPERKRTRSSSSVTSPPLSPANSKAAIPGLGREQILQYKKRMMEISKQRSPTAAAAAPQSRASLFDDDEISMAMAKVDKDSIQKNRTGREVRQAATTVHLAHILLNVHNKTPLEAFNQVKMSKNGAAPRLQRLVRIAKKSQKMRLIRLRNRVRQSLAQTVTIE